MDVESYELEKEVWSQKDFERMGWHDCVIYGIRFEDEILFDIDYILKWVLSEDGASYSFFVSPATMKFRSARDLKINIDLDFINGLEIADLHMKQLESEYQVTIELQEGEISFVCSGFEQFIKKAPKHQKGMCLSEEDRGGYNFDIL